MEYVQDIIFVYNALLREYSSLLELDLTTGYFDLKDLTFNQDDLVRVLTVDHPKYDNYLLSYLRGSSDIKATQALMDQEPFRTLFPAICQEEGSVNVLAVEAFRQLALFGKKLKAPCGDHLNQQMIDRMFFTDKSLPLRLERDAVLRLASQLVTSVVGVVPPLQALSDCSHGSGASADRVSVPHRWEPSVMKFTPALYALSDFTDMRAEAVSIDNYVSRVLLVSKDARGPRVICCEPSTLMAHQQSVRKWIHNRVNTFELTRGRVNLLDQKVNQQLAYEGSVNLRWATIDMAEASDRVSLALVNALFPPVWRHLLKTLRSKAYTQDHATRPRVTMRKFAPMGSALCFPVETLVFWALSSAAIARVRHCNIEAAARLCTVHGDDTIVPSDCAEAVITTLETYGLKVNSDKSFYTGFFRESCGGDFYRGHNVTPVRHNELWNAETRIQRLTVLRNGFYSKGLWSTAKAIESMIPCDELFTTSVTAEVANTRTTFNPAFVGGRVVGQSKYHHAVFSCYTNQPKCYKERPTDVGRWMQYWAERPNVLPTTVGHNGFQYEEWTGGHTTSIVKRKGKVCVQKKSIYTQRGECLKRARVEIGLQPSLVNKLKTACFFTRPIVK